MRPLNNVPMVCSLGTPEFSARRAEIQLLLNEATCVSALDDGVEMKFVGSADVAHTLLDFILFERVCCSGLSYELRSKPDHSQLTLRLSLGQNAAPEQVKSLQAMYLPQPEVEGRPSSGVF